MRRALLMVLVVVPAGAWDSKINADRGPLAARAVWSGEHPEMFRALLAERNYDDPQRTLTTWTDGTDHRDDLPSVAPAVAFSLVEGRQERAYDVSMFAALPDATWSVSDWMLGNERCPLPEPWASGCLLGEDCCFTFFDGWLSGLNATHFLPQAEHAWAYHHGLALQLADRCVALRTRNEALGYAKDDPYVEVLDGIVEECEVEALVFEATAHHYLQDAWSSGHMWNRWGSPHPADWGDGASPGADLLHALSVGLISGILHGFAAVHDPMVGPHADVAYTQGGGTVVHAIGDEHHALLATEAPDQLAAMNACFAASLDELVGKLQGGALELQAVGPTTGVDRDACFGQRATNLAMQTGLLQVGPLSPAETLLYLGALHLVVELEWQELAEALDEAFRHDALALAVIADASRWATGPYGDELAEGFYEEGGDLHTLTLLGAQPNHVWAEGYLADAPTRGFLTFDPPAGVLVNGEVGDTKQAWDAWALRLGFHAAHADQWCERFDLDDDLQELARACATSDDSEAREANCDACATMAAWFHRDGTGPDDYDEAAEPFCQAWDDEGAIEYLYVSTDGGARDAAVRSWCEGCNGFIASDDGLYRFCPGTPTDQLGATIDKIYGIDWSPRGVAATPDAAFVATESLGLVKVATDGTDTLLAAGCTTRGVDVHDGVVYVVCEAQNEVRSLDAQTGAEIDRFDLDDVSRVSQPYGVTVAPGGGQIAIASRGQFAQEDGVTFLQVAGGTFGTAKKVPIQLDSYTIGGDGGYTSLEGLFFASTRRLAYDRTGTTLYASNFGNVECIASISTTCLLLSPYWVSVVDVGSATMTHNVGVVNRTWAVDRAWDDLVLVSDLVADQIYVFDGGPAYEAVATTGQGPGSLAPHQPSKRIFVGYHELAGTCGFGVLDAADPDPAAWRAETVLTEAGCARYVDVHGGLSP